MFEGPTELFAGRPENTAIRHPIEPEQPLMLSCFRPPVLMSLMLTKKRLSLRSHRLALLAEHALYTEIQAATWMVQLETNQRIQGLTVEDSAPLVGM